MENTKTRKVWSEKEIEDNLLINNDQLIKALLVLYKYQTVSERADETTKYVNGVGFSGFDAKILSSFAEWYNGHKYLSPKQMVVLRKRMMKYVKQLTKIANGEITAADEPDEPRSSERRHYSRHSQGWSHSLAYEK